jgi:hypothetical protein
MPELSSDRVKAFFLDPRVYLGALVLIAFGAGLQQILLGRTTDGYTRFNNYLIFKRSFFHLVENKDLYLLYPAEHFDHYKYSPTFAALMAPFALLPDAAGLLAWDLANALVLVLAIQRLPLLDWRAKGLIAWFIAPELLGSIQNSQANVLLTGLFLLAFCSCEGRKVVLAPLVVALSFYIKPFGLVAILLFLLYPERKRLLLHAAAWVTLLALVPLLLVSFDQLKLLYGSWLGLLSADHAASTGLSVVGWLHAWFGLDPPKLLVVVLGAALGVAPLLNAKAHRDPGFRLVFLASILVWVVIFNHKAESPTFVLAMCGVALWYFSQVRTPLHSVLAVLALLLTSLAYSDLTPAYLKDQLVKPYVLKVVPHVLVWLKMIHELALWPRDAKVAPGRG